ncbi:hypothetical protein VKT23_016677 [Stygiomarasmius scandens]|uniref:Uncharacterized protein n=1 Tax=Marasmiellus scandens TaxID=2682957 RepID=A0ABR1IU59_9AGAR
MSSNVAQSNLEAVSQETRSVKTVQGAAAQDTDAVPEANVDVDAEPKPADGEMFETSWKYRSWRLKTCKYWKWLESGQDPSWSPGWEFLELPKIPQGRDEAKEWLFEQIHLPRSQYPSYTDWTFSSLPEAYQDSLCSFIYARDEIVAGHLHWRQSPASTDLSLGRLDNVSWCHEQASRVRNANAPMPTFSAAELFERRETVFRRLKLVFDTLQNSINKIVELGSARCQLTSDTSPALREHLLDLARQENGRCIVLHAEFDQLDQAVSDLLFLTAVVIVYAH